MRKKDVLFLFVSGMIVLLLAGCSTTGEPAKEETARKVAKQVVKMGIRRSPVAVLKAVK